MCNLLVESLDEKEKLNLDAIARIHRHLDDDKNGNVDLQESIEVSLISRDILFSTIKAPISPPFQ